MRKKAFKGMLFSGLLLLVCINEIQAGNFYQKMLRQVKIEITKTLVEKANIPEQQAYSLLSEMMACGGVIGGIADGDDLMLWGNNGGAATWTATGAPTNYELLSRQWHVQETSTVGAVKMQFDVADVGFDVPDLVSGTAYYLIYDADNDGDLDDEIPIALTNSSGTLWETSTNVDFADGVKFTIATSTVVPDAPGGVAGASLWLRADIGVTGTTEITNWDDQSGNNRNAVNYDATEPSLITSNDNFNPSLQINGGGGNGGMISTSTGVTRNEIFVIARNQNGGIYRSLIGNNSGGNSSARHFAVHNNNFDNSNSGWNYTMPGVHTSRIDGVESNNFGSNGRLRIASSRTTNVPPSVPVVIGGRGLSGTGNNAWPGTISEVITFGVDLNDTERQQVESYLALKYGITLNQTTAQDYLASDGTTKMWDATVNSTYSNDVTGIGQDDDSNLLQKQSKSVNTDGIVAMGLTSIEVSNAANTATFAADKNFMVWGNDDGAATWTTTGAHAGGEILTRTWHIQETGTVGAVKMQFDVGDVDFDVPDLNIGTAYHLIYDSDNDSDLSDETPVTLINSSGDIWETIVNIDFADGMEFTLASNIDPCDAALSGNLDTDSDGISDICDCDDDNDGISDFEEQGHYVSANVSGTWLGPTASIMTITNNIAPNYDVANSLDFDDNVYQKNFLLGTDNGGTSYFAANSYDLTITFSTPVPANEIAFFMVTRTTASGTFLINGQPAGDILRQDASGANLNSLKDRLLYNSGSSGFQYLGNHLYNAMLIRGVGCDLVSTFEIQGSTAFGSTTYSFGAINRQDTDGDGDEDYLDIDSDADGCPDSDEAYNSLDRASDNGKYDRAAALLGNTTVDSLIPVDARGLVIEAGVNGGQSQYNTRPTKPSGQSTTSERRTFKEPVRIVTGTAPSDIYTSIGSTVTFETGTGASPDSAHIAERATVFSSGSPDFSIDSLIVNETTGLRYKWTVDTGSGAFGNIPNTANDAVEDLVLTNITAAMFGNIYRLTISHLDMVCVEIYDALLLPDPCDLIASGNTDTDGDGISDICDLDDDNDGILDVDEMYCPAVIPIDWNPVTGTIGMNAITTAAWTNGSALSTFQGNSYSNYTPVMPAGRVANANSGVRIFTFEDPISSINIGLLNVDGYSQTYTDENNNPLTIKVIDATNAIVLGNTLQDNDPTTYSNGLSLGGIFEISSQTPFSEIHVTYNLLPGGGSDGHIFSFSMSGPCVDLDTDKDNIVDHLDSDSDGDGCFDINEAYASTTIPDSDGDGVADDGINNPPTLTNGGIDSCGLVIAAGIAIDSTYTTTPDTTIAGRNTFQEAVQFTVTSPPTDTTVLAGNGASFTILTNAETADSYATDSSGTPLYITMDNDAAAGVTYIWYLGDPATTGTDLADVGVYSNTDSATLLISNATGLYGKEYFVVANHTSNTCEADTLSAFLLAPDLCDPIASGNIDTDGDGVSDLCDCDDDNDGISDYEEQGDFVSANVSGPWPGPTTSTMTVVSSITPTNNTTRTLDLDDNTYVKNFLLGTANGGSNYYSGKNFVITVSFSTPVPASEIAFLAGPINQTPATFTFTINGEPAGTDLVQDDSGANQNAYNDRLRYFSGNSHLRHTGELFNNLGIVRGATHKLVSEFSVASNSVNTPFSSIGAIQSIDTDGDTFPDYLDIDSDGDGCLDSDEAYGFENSANGNGRFDRANVALGTPADDDSISVTSTGLVIEAGANTGVSHYNSRPNRPSGIPNTSARRTFREPTRIVAGTAPDDVTAFEAETATFQTGADATVNIAHSADRAILYNGGLPDYSSGTIDETAGLRYKWTVDTGDGIFVDIPNADTPNDTAEDLVLTNVTLAMNGNIYRLSITHVNVVCTEIFDAKLTVGIDTDGDGVADSNDKDDDNDGILDEVEYNCTFVDLLPSDLGITSPGSNYSGTENIGDLFGLPDADVVIAYSGVSVHSNIVPLLLFEYGDGIVSEMTITSSNKEFNLFLKDGGGEAYFPNVIKGFEVNNEADGYDLLAAPTNDLIVTSGGDSISITNPTNGPISSYSAKWISKAPVSTITFKPFSNSPPSLTYLIGLCFPADTDSDDIVDYLDLDSDNDGIYDADEAGHSAAHTAGQLTGGVNAVNGIPNNVDDGSNGVNYTLADSEATPDGTPDFLEIDSDGDGCNDTNEAGFTDGDDNGLLGTGTFGAGLTVDADGVVTSGTDGYTAPTQTNGGTNDFQDAITQSGCNEAPVITNNSSNPTTTQDYAENGTSDVIDWDATDPDGETENSGGLTYALTGADATLFTLDSATGILTWNTSPDFENPMDADTDNVYQVQVQVCDSGPLCDVQMMTITVTDVDEDGDGLTSPADPNDMDPCVPNNAASPCCEAVAPTITKD